MSMCFTKYWLIQLSKDVKVDRDQFYFKVLKTQLLFQKTWLHSLPWYGPHFLFIYRDSIKIQDVKYVMYITSNFPKENPSFSLFKTYSKKILK